MPNQNNIRSPITLVSFGRSGTSLVSDIFKRHPDCFAAGETLDLIFDPWRAVEMSGGRIQPLKGNDGVSSEELAGRVVRNVFLTCFSSDRPRWFHKPIGIPTNSAGADEAQWSERATWYWKVMRGAFPEAQYFTILRHPCDVVLSAQSYWGYGQRSMWQGLGFMAYLLTHPASPIEYAIHFEELVHNSEAVVRDLCAFLDLPFNAVVLEAFSSVHAASARRDRLPSLNLATRRNEWNQLDPTEASPLYVKHIVNLFDRFEYSLQLPQKFAEDNSMVLETQEDSEQAVRRLEGEMDRLHKSYTAQLQERERILVATQDELKRLTATLEQGKNAPSRGAGH